MKLIDVEHIPYEDGFDRVNGNKHFIYGVETMQEWIRQQEVIDPVSIGLAQLLLDSDKYGLTGKQRSQVEALLLKAVSLRGKKDDKE